MANKKPRSLYEMSKTIRRDWGGFNPRTRTVESDKIYSRQKNKEEVRNLIDEDCEDFYLEDAE